MIKPQTSIFKPEKPFIFHPDFKNWDGASYEEETVNGKRVYSINGRRYPSITTVLSFDPIKKEILHKWRKRVGEQEANKIKASTSSRGKSLHKICEDYLGKNEAAISSYAERENFFKIKATLEKRIGQIFCIESVLFSDRLGIAGRCDLIAEWWNGETYELVVLDFKTSTKKKHRGSINHYFIQGTAYAEMFKDMTGISIPSVVILMTTEELMEPQIFEEKTSEWLEPLNKAITTYKEATDVQKTPSHASLSGI